jgi:hypothetical protein
LRIGYLKAQIEASRRHASGLAKEFAKARSEDEKVRIGHQYDDAVRRTQALQASLEIAEGKEKDEGHRPGAEPLKNDEERSC